MGGEGTQSRKGKPTVRWATALHSGPYAPQGTDCSWGHRQPGLSATCSPLCTHPWLGKPSMPWAEDAKAEAAPSLPALPTAPRRSGRLLPSRPSFSGALDLTFPICLRRSPMSYSWGKPILARAISPQCGGDSVPFAAGEATSSDPGGAEPAADPASQWVAQEIPGNRPPGQSETTHFPPSQSLDPPALCLCPPPLRTAAAPKGP